ncbi:helix-turn-helix domain-containing protein [Pseudonocardia sp. D17]|uniref:helix-turn-helix domain-containing protein n=1 Tax=Pseudonocardia sp. D17 TaxID=882661 RepID=UPI0030CB4CFA
MTSSVAHPSGVASAGTRSREREVIAAFAEITTEAITAPGLEDLLQLIGRQLCRLLAVHRCSVYLRRGDRFTGAAGHCEIEGDISAAVQAQEAGIAGDAFSQEVIATRRPVLISDVPADPRPHRRTMEHWRVRAMLGVPLVFDGDVIGLIFVDNVEEEHTYSDDDVGLAELFGRLAAIFIRQAVLNSRLAAKAAEVVRQKNVLGYLATVHHKLTDAVLEGADIGAVVTMLSELAAKPVVLYDDAFGVLAWAAPTALRMTEPPVLDRRTREHPAVRTALTALSASRPSTVVPMLPAVGFGRRHQLTRLTIEGRPGGYLAVVEVGRGLSDLDAKLAESGATVLALQILSERRQIEAEGQARDDFLSDLLRSTRDEAQLLRRGPQFGIDLSEPHVIVRLAVGGGVSQLSASAGRGLVVRRFAAVLGGAEPPAVGLPGAVVVLVRLGGRAGGPAELRDHVAEVVASLGPQLDVRTAVVSRVCRAAADFPRAHRELREVEELAASFGWREGVRTVDELGLFRVVMNSGQVKEALRFAHDLVAPVRAHEAGDGPLLTTWRAFVAAEGKVQATARTLDVHENTVRYRLGRVRELTGTDPADLDVLLSARLAFQVLDLAGW